MHKFNQPVLFSIAGISTPIIKGSLAILIRVGFLLGGIYFVVRWVTKPILTISLR